jgi:hypothetical protein
MCTHSQLDTQNEDVMIQISLPYIYNLAASLRPLAAIQGDTPYKDSMYALFNAETILNQFLTQSVYSASLKATVAPGMKLLQTIKKLTADPDIEKTLGFLDTYYLSSALGEFEMVLTAEMNVGNAYLVTKKRGYDTSDLISQAEVLFPVELKYKIPDAIPDIREAGKCLAFELGTAAGFHIMRATELVIRVYWDAVTNGEERPKTSNIGDYLRELDQRDAGEPKTRATLRQIKDLHRNELMHPEVSLTLDDAVALLGIAQSAIIAMMREIDEPKLTSGVPIAELTS